MDRPHPLGVPGRQVVIDRDQVNALASQGVEVGGHGRDQGLSLSGLHLGDSSLMESSRPDHLHVVGPLAQHPPGDFPHNRERFRSQVVEAFAARDSLSKVPGAGGKLGVGEPLGVTLQRVDPVRQSRQALERTAFPRLENLGENSHPYLDAI